MTRNSLHNALLAKPADYSPRSNEQLAWEMVELWKTEAEALAHNMRDRLDDSLDLKSAVMAGRTNDNRQAIAVVEQQLSAKKGLAEMLAVISSESVIDEAYRYATQVITCKEKGEEYDGDLPDLLSGLRRLREFSDIHGDSLVQSVQGTTINNVIAMLAKTATTEAPKPKAIEGKPHCDPSSWVTASTLWKERFTTIKEVTKFREKHPDMFRNPSKFKLDIHAGLWSRHWADRDKTSFETLNGELPSVADDPDIQDDALAAAAKRMAAIRQKNQSGKQ